MKAGITISAVAHGALLVWGLIAFSAKPFDAAETPSLPVDIISASEFSQITAGARNAPQTEAPKPLVEKVAEAKPVEDPNAKVDKKDITATAEKPPLPEPKPPEPKQQDSEPPPAKQEVKPAEQAAKEPEPKRDLIAEAIKNDAAKKPEPKPAAVTTPIPPKRPKPQPPKFDPRQVAALLDKRDPQRHAATGDAVNPSSSLGLSSGLAPRLSQTELEALRARLAQFWNPPVGAKDPRELIVQVRLRLNKDGSLAAPPQILSSGRSVMFMAARDSAVRAIFRGAPFTMLNPRNYETWKDVEITFDPRDMFRG